MNATETVYIQLFHAHYDAAHLEAVKAEMQQLGAPTIKAVRTDNNTWIALEGCHRLRAAAQLGLLPEIEEVEYSEEMTREDLGLDGDGPLTVAECVDASQRSRNIVVLEFEYDRDDYYYEHGRI